MSKEEISNHTQSTGNSRLIGTLNDMLHRLAVIEERAVAAEARIAELEKERNKKEARINESLLNISGNDLSSPIMPEELLISLGANPSPPLINAIKTNGFGSYNFVESTLKSIRTFHPDDGDYFDINKIYSDGNTLMSLAIAKGNGRITGLLQSYGAKTPEQLAQDVAGIDYGGGNAAADEGRSDNHTGGGGSAEEDRPLAKKAKIQLNHNPPKEPLQSLHTGNAANASKSNQSAAGGKALYQIKQEQNTTSGGGEAANRNPQQPSTRTQKPNTPQKSTVEGQHKR